MSRWSFRPTDVRVRVTAAATLAALVVLILGSLLFLISLRGSLERGLETTSSQQVSSVQAQLNAGEDADQVVITGKNDILVQVIGPDGTVVATDHPASPRPCSPRRARTGTCRFAGSRTPTSRSRVTRKVATG